MKTVCAALTVLLILIAPALEAQVAASVSDRLPAVGIPGALEQGSGQDRQPSNRLGGGAPKARGFNLPRQTNEFYHLSGIETPHAYLIFDGRDRSVTLLLPPRDPRLESAEGKVLSAEDADEVKRLTGVTKVVSTKAMTEDWLRQLLGGAATTVYTPFAPGKATPSAAASSEAPMPPSRPTRGMAGLPARPGWSSS